MSAQSVAAGARPGGSASRGLVLAADVGGTTTRVGLVDADGRVSAIRRTPTPEGADAVIAHLVDQLHGVLADAAACASPTDASAPVAGATVGGIAIAIPGRLDDDGDAWSMALNLGVSGPIALRSALESQLPGPIHIGNDVRLAALGAAHHHPDAERLAYVSVGTGVAGCLIDRSNGPDLTLDLPGEVGHLPVPGLGVPCVCGQIGCAEAGAGGRSMIQQWQARGGDESVDIGGIWALAAEGRESAAVVVRNNCVAALASITQMYVVAVGADAVVIGGGISRLGDQLLDAVRFELGRRGNASAFVTGYHLPDRIRLAPPDSEFGLVGAGLTALPK